jgi:pimeloyl-ACP methyl ester carboxylesterase
VRSAPAYRTLDVAVAGGTLRVGCWGDPDRPVVIAAHGITASHLAWARVAGELGAGVCLVAPDLRGRGGSSGLPGPYGMAAHAADLVAVLDALGVERAVLAGHSMGAFVAAVAAARWPERAERLVMVDGGLPLPVPAGVDVDAVLDAVIGPAMARLRTDFASPAAYRDFWRAHPAFAQTGTWDALVEAYVDYDLEPASDGRFRSRASLDAVRADGADVLAGDDARAALERVRCPAVLLWAERGMLNEPDGLYGEAVVQDAAARHRGLATELVPGTNHYTILLAPAGAAAVARHLAPPSGDRSH